MRRAHWDPQYEEEAAGDLGPPFIIHVCPCVGVFAMSVSCVLLPLHVPVSGSVTMYATFVVWPATGTGLAAVRLSAQAASRANLNARPSWEKSGLVVRVSVHD